MAGIGSVAREGLTLWGWSLWVWVLAACILIGVIIWIIRSARRRNTVNIGNAQILGAAATQNDYFATYKNENGLIAIVSDGIGRKHYGRYCAEIVVKTYFNQFKKSKSIQDTQLFLQRTLYLANQRVTKVGLDINCGAMLSAVILQDNTLFWINVGNTAIMVADKEKITRLNQTYTDTYSSEEASKIKPAAYYNEYIGIEDKLKAQTGKVTLQRGQQVVLCTDGVYMQISEMDMLKILKQRTAAFDKAQKILLKIQRKQRTDQDNATLIVLNIN